MSQPAKMQSDLSKKIPISEFLDSLAERTLFDVRTPSEFAQGHIPGALNLPLFSDEERKVVGTIYKQESPDKAFLKGLEFAGRKMDTYVRSAREMAAGKTVAVHCWRGGKRSESIAWLLGMTGFDTLTLKGGYKAYRNFILNGFWEMRLPLVVLGGKTGSGKTEILAELARMGEQVVDLEGLANHKGSAFGALGEAPQPTVEQFENDLFDRIVRLDPKRRIWIENESKSIGRVYLPDGFWDQKRRARLIQLEVPFAIRVERLVTDYSGFPLDGLRNSFEKIRKRLGGLALKQALEALDAGDFETAAAIGLAYYDKTYQHSLERGDFSAIRNLKVQSNDPQACATELVGLADQAGW